MKTVPALQRRQPMEIIMRAIVGLAAIGGGLEFVANPPRPSLASAIARVRVRRLSIGCFLTNTEVRRFYTRMLTALAVEKVAENGQAIANSLYQDSRKASSRSPNTRRVGVEGRRGPAGCAVGRMSGDDNI
jgi:hypothetical protein